MGRALMNRVACVDSKGFGCQRSLQVLLAISLLLSAGMRVRGQSAQSPVSSQMPQQKPSSQATPPPQPTPFRVPSLPAPSPAPVTAPSPGASPSPVSLPTQNDQNLNPLTLDEALRLANVQSSIYQQAALNERIAAEDVKQAQAAFLPRVMWILPVACARRWQRTARCLRRRTPELRWPAERWPRR